MSIHFLIFLVITFELVIADQNLLDVHLAAKQELDGELSFYVRWLSENLPFKSENENLNCVDLVVLYGRKFSEFINKLLFVLSDVIPITFRHRNEKRLFRDKNFIPCKMIVLLDYSIDEETRLKNIRVNGIINKSKYFLVLVPPVFPYSKDNHNIEQQQQIESPIEWPTEIFTHAEVIVVVNFTIFHLQSPFGIEKRNFDIITTTSTKEGVANEKGGHRKWKNEKNVALNFRGKHLRALTWNCDSHNYWNFHVGIEEIVCETTTTTTTTMKNNNSNSNTNTNSKRKSICGKNNEFPLINSKQFILLLLLTVEAEGIESKLMMILADSLNFTWSMATPLKGSFGVIQQDETMDGMIGEVGNKNFKKSRVVENKLQTIKI